MNATVDRARELRYLAELTKAGLKPMSRWEKDFTDATLDWLRQSGLQTRVIHRPVANGRSVRELTFSLHPSCLVAYAAHFEGRPIDGDRRSRRIEGRLFGYPACCVESYVAAGYQANALTREDQALFFHWACPRCLVTPLLIPLYRRIHDRLAAEEADRRTPAPPCRRSRHRGRLGALSSLLAAAGLVAAVGSPPDPHRQPLPPTEDSDEDLLKNAEEKILGFAPDVADEDGNAVPDGIDLARELLASLKALPRAMEPEVGPKDRPFVVEHPMDGIEICPKCGERVVMDIWDVHHPVTGTLIRVSSMALHYLTHGGFRWEGGQLLGGTGRVDPIHLQAVLAGEGDGHRLSVQPDADADLLSDGEEAELGTDPANPDEDRNQTPDGVDLARLLAAKINALPTKPLSDHVYRQDHLLRGLEWCAICGETVNMGHVTICNPGAGLYAKLPCIALHFMEHGSFSYAGDIHGADRTEIKLLGDTLEATHADHVRSHEGDGDRDGLRDGEEARFRCQADQSDSDQDGVPDGFALAREMWRTLNELSRNPREPIRAEDHRLRGLVTCEVCGAQVNKGYLEVVNEPEQLRLTVPYLALHALECGSFDYGTRDRLNPRLLDVALNGNGTSHLAKVADDGDLDGLSDAEEEQLGTMVDVPDTDANGVPDGADLARALHARLMRLPADGPTDRTHVTHHVAKCEAPCPICGEAINCGYCEIINPWAELTMEVPYLNVHFLEHGGFGPPEGKRTDPVRLEAILAPGVVISVGNGLAVLRWPGLPGRTYETFAAPAIDGPWTPGPVFHGDGSEIVFEPSDEHRQGQAFFKIAVSPSAPGDLLSRDDAVR